MATSCVGAPRHCFAVRDKCADPRTAPLNGAGPAKLALSWLLVLSVSWASLVPSSRRPVPERGISHQRASGLMRAVGPLL